MFENVTCEKGAAESTLSDPVVSLLRVPFLLVHMSLVTFDSLIYMLEADYDVYVSREN